MMIKPTHSDFLIHWTGNDIDKQCPNWYRKQDVRLNKDIVKPYLERLKFILKYGLWMTSGRSYIQFKEQKIKRPFFSRTCFTELKLSDAEAHAQRFGHLGIGFKRFFLFERLGSPMVYFRPGAHNWFISPLFAGEEIGKGRRTTIALKDYWACFLKSMHEKKKRLHQFVAYKQFEESEWRIIWSEEINKKFFQGGSQLFKKPNEINDKEFKKYIESKPKKPDFLIPLEDPGTTYSRWLAMIIYPSLAVKVAAEADADIRKEIKRLKPIVKTLDGLSGSASYEKYSKPLEINLQACRNF
ncbi:MAG TPA: hypothetical protein DCL35_07275 [Candidatus Omnitrophica bacterium]|nr:hypothetical protein [Candidatus Omnitrophota bacterium]